MDAATRNLCFLMGIAALLVLSAGYEDPKMEGYEVVPSPEDCKCFPYYQCSNGSVIEDGATLIDIRFSMSSSNVSKSDSPIVISDPGIKVVHSSSKKSNWIPGSLMMIGGSLVETLEENMENLTWCETREIFTYIPSYAFIPITFTSKNRIRVEACENYIDVCCKVPLEVKPEDKDKVDRGEEQSWENCGVRHPKGVAFKITGDKDGEAQFGEFPWMTAILKEVKNDPEEKETVHKTSRKYLCGGSLIHPHVVLTGAHCVHSYTDDKLIVRLGEWDSQTKKEIYPHQEREVYKIIIYPDFKKNSLHNDMALLYFTEPIKPSKHIGIVCLPDKKQSPPANTRCLASGWGATEFDKSGKYSTILKKVEVPVVDNGKCQDYLRKTRLGSHFKLHESFMCAGGEKGKDTCKGDGGSPLVCPHPDHPEHFIQAGIVAWGIGCNDPEVPGVYANVAHFMEWIDEKMWELDLDKSYYLPPK